MMERRCGDEMDIFHHVWSAPLEDANGKLIEELDISKEQEMLEKLFSRRPGLQYRSAVATEPELMVAMANSHVLHFSGHGLPGGVVLEHGHTAELKLLGSSKIVSPEQLRGMFSYMSGRRPRFAFVSACHSEVTPPPTSASGRNLWHPII